MIYISRVSAFSFYLKKKSKLCPQKGKQASLKSKSFCAMLRKKRLKCGRIPVRLFLACHQKSNTFKCKQFCCAKPMCACLFMGFAPRPRERRAAAHNPRLSFSCSAHSPVNSLRSNNTGSCVLLRKPFPRQSPSDIKHFGAAIGSLIIKTSRQSTFVKIRANQINKSKFIKPIKLARLYTLRQQKTTYEP